MNMKLLISVIVLICSLGLMATTAMSQPLPARNISLAPPDGASIASGTVHLQPFNLNGSNPNFPSLITVGASVAALPCGEFVGTPVSEQFYGLYLTSFENSSDTIGRRIRVRSFHVSCGQGGAGGSAQFQVFMVADGNFSIDFLAQLLTKPISVDVYVELDDGIDAPDAGGQLVLQGAD